MAYRDQLAATQEELDRTKEKLSQLEEICNHLKGTKVNKRRTLRVKLLKKFAKIIAISLTIFVVVSLIGLGAFRCNDVTNENNARLHRQCTETVRRFDVPCVSGTTHWSSNLARCYCLDSRDRVSTQPFDRF